MEYHVFIDPNRKLFNVDSPVKIKGVPIEISRYIDFAFTVVDGKINGPATSTFKLRNMENSFGTMFSDEKEIIKEALGLSFNTNIVSASNIYGLIFNEKINVLNSRGDLIYSFDNEDFMDNCWMSSDDIVIKNSGKEINLLTGNISKDDDVWIGSYSIGKKKNGDWEVIVIEHNRITMEERKMVGGLELRPEASPVMGLGDYYNSIALRLITGVY